MKEAFFCSLASFSEVQPKVIYAMSKLIPRKTLFGNPHRAAVKISHDGNYISFLAADEGVMNVWVAAATTPEQARVITNDRSTGIAQYFWSYNNRHLLYLQDNDGDEDFHLYSVDVESGDVIDLTPFENISAQVVHLSHRHQDEILVGINDRGQHWFHDIYRINISNGERVLVERNDQFVGFIADDELEVRIALAMTPESDMLLLSRDTKGEDWAPFQTIQAIDIMTTTPIGFDQSGNVLYFLDSRNRDKAGISALDFGTGESELIYASDKADVNGVLTHPTENTIQIVTYTYERVEHAVLDDRLRSDMEYLEAVCDGEIEITSQTLDQHQWVVAFATDDGPVRYYLHDRTNCHAKFLFTNRPELESLELSKMHPVVIQSRDGMDLVSYLTLPKSSGDGNRPAQPVPMVLLVHGGPWYRDFWGYHPEHQLLANRGYAVLSVNFRGSTGLGKDFINAADKQWAGKMHDDLIDAVNWSILEGIADRDRIAIMGGSYGGYATLVGLTFTPDVFACGIDIVGPSNLITLMENPPPYWMPLLPMMTTRVGDHATDEGRQFLESRSPLFRVDQIRRPLLIGQGANDPRVKQSESDQIVAAMQEKNIPVTYVLYPEEGHGFDRPENDIAFYAICESFLAEHLGGSCEEVGDDFAGAKFEVKAGADHVPAIA